MKTKILILIAFWGLLIPGVNAQQSHSLESEIDAYLLPYIQMNDFSGQILVAKDGKVLVRKGYGLANHELSVKNSLKTKFHIASLSKTFTSAAVILLEKEGKLKLDDDLGKYLKDYPNGKGITIVQLLTHSAGVPDFASLAGYEDLVTSRLTKSDWLKMIKARPLDFEPGTRNSYSNAGYGLLAEVIEKASGESYESYIRKRILGPLGMTNTGHWSDEDVIVNRASGYDPSFVTESGLINTAHYDKGVLWGSGSFFSTADDLYLWYKAVQKGTLFKIDSLAYPFGWGVRKRFDLDLIEQDGSDPGFAAHISAYLKEDLCVIVLSNIRTGAINKIKEDLAAIALGKEYSPIAPRKVVKVPTRLLEEYVGQYELSPQMMLSLKVVDGSLFLKGTGGTFLPLEPLSETTFFYPQFYVPIVFSRDSEGRVDKLLWDGSYPIKRISK